MKYTFGLGCQIKNLNEIYLKYLGYKPDGIFVEVGAFNGYNWSNTYGLAKIGWKGLMFEPQKDMYFECHGRYKNNPNIEVVRMALSDWHGETTLYLGGSISTIDKEQRDAYLEIPWSRATTLPRGREVNVPVSTLARELSARNWPAKYDVLVVDVEGSELAVLKGSEQLACRPTLAIVETHALNEHESLSAKAGPIDTFFEELGYTKVQEDTINTIYAEKNSTKEN